VDLQGVERLEDRDCRTTCRTCGQEQTLEAATVNQADPLETIYGCVNGCGTILIVTTPGVILWEGRGYRMRDWAIRNPSDLFVRPPGADRDVLFPASPAALE